MIIAELVEELKKYPLDATVIAYEGEAVGITIMQNNREIGFIPTPEDSSPLPA